LGFLLNTLEQKFKVAPSKVEKIKAALREAIAKTSTTNRELASPAGRLVAVSMAVLPALLFSRSIFQAMAGQDSWDTWFPNPQSVSEEAQVWLDNLDAWNGRLWWPRHVQLKLCIDASALGYGGFIEGPDGRRMELAGTFSQQEGQLSSAAREIIGYARSIKVASQAFSRQLRNSAVLMLGDSQAALGALRKFASPSRSSIRNSKAFSSRAHMVRLTSSPAGSLRNTSQRRTNLVANQTHRIGAARRS
jgi:hypothetical protein